MKFERILILILFIWCLGLTILYFYIPEGNDTDKFIISTDDKIPNNTITNKEYNKLSKVVNTNDINIPYQRYVYDCREYSVVMLKILQDNGYESGLCSIRFFITGHRIVWVNVNNTTLFIDPQINRIFTLGKLKSTYPNSNKIILYNYK